VSFWPCFVLNQTARLSPEKTSGLLFDINIRKICGNAGGTDVKACKIKDRRRLTPSALRWTPLSLPTAESGDGLSNPYFFPHQQMSFG